jgi:hypothetical protein
MLVWGLLVILSRGGTYGKQINKSVGKIKTQISID